MNHRKNLFEEKSLKSNLLILLVLLGGLVMTCAFSSVFSTFSTKWMDSEIGAPTGKGGHSMSGGQLTVTGAGKGDEQMHFTYTPHPGGDFDIMARIVSTTAAPHAKAGIMVRSAASPANPAMAQVSYCLQDAKEGLNSLRWFARDAATSSKSSGGIAIKREAPIWLRMVRIAGNFAVYKSADGQIWSTMSNVSGWKFTPEGPLEIGFFTGSGDPAKTVEATFDNIKIGLPNLGYRTSWVGNSFGARDEDKHVSNTLSAMWVAPDGTCYTSSYWDEGGRPVTSYRDGKAARALPVGTPQTAEGGITGDNKYIYVAAVDRITKLDPAAPDFAPKPLTLSVNLLDKQKKSSVVSGLASNGSELFVADSRDNLIRVVTLEPPKPYHVPGAANDGVALAPSPVVVPEDDKRFAPALVYQTQRIGEWNKYTIPGFTPGGIYTVRCHFAEYKELPAKRDPRNGVVNIKISGAPQDTKINVAEEAGGILKALVKDFPGCKAEKDGSIIVNHSAYGGPGICGFEILDADGKRLFAVNCGGPAVGDFKGESAELVDRAFAFERPGPMAFDKRGDLWIIQRGSDFPIGGMTTAKYKAAVKCYKTDGTFTGREIPDVTNPRALGYDAAKDQLLVAENGPDMNVRFYSGLDKSPSLARVFGEKGGIYAGENPGLVHDPAAGGYARFAGVAGVGMDTQGNLYVGGGFQGTDLRMFKPDGKLGWMLNSLMFCNTYDFDPDSDGTDIYGTYNHLKLDFSKNEPGKEQKYFGYNWDLRNYGNPVRAGSSQAIVRRLGADRRLFMFTSGQGQIGDINIYRYEGEIAIPAGGTREKGKNLWIDANGDGKEDPEEIYKMESQIGWITGICIDSKGDIWAGNATTGGSWMRHFFFKGLNEKGVPVYSGVKGEGWEDVRFPEEGNKTNAWAMSCKLDYDADRDIMVCFYPITRTIAGRDKDNKEIITTYGQYALGRYDNWSKGNRQPTWKIPVPSQESTPEYFMYEVGKPYNCSGYMGMQMAGDYLFLAHLWGESHVFDLATGKLVKILSMGPEVAGSCAWEDAAMGLRVFKRKNGEYLVFTENSGWGGKCNFFRWKP